MVPGSSGGDNVILDSPSQASMHMAAALTSSRSLPHQGEGLYPFLALLADEVIE
jgi:hypothetical protein